MLEKRKKDQHKFMVFCKILRSIMLVIGLSAILMVSSSQKQNGMRVRKFFPGFGLCLLQQGISEI